MNIFPCCKGWRTAVYYCSISVVFPISKPPTPTACDQLQMRKASLRSEFTLLKINHCLSSYCIQSLSKLLCLYNNDNRPLWSTLFPFRFLWILYQLNSIIARTSRYMFEMPLNTMTDGFYKNSMNKELRLIYLNLPWWVLSIGMVTW